MNPHQRERLIENALIAGLCAWLGVVLWMALYQAPPRPAPPEPQFIQVGPRPASPPPPTPNNPRVK